MEKGQERDHFDNCSHGESEARERERERDGEIDNLLVT